MPQRTDKADWFFIGFWLAAFLFCLWTYLALGKLLLGLGE